MNKLAVIVPPKRKGLKATLRDKDILIMEMQRLNGNAQYTLTLLAIGIKTGKLDELKEWADVWLKKANFGEDGEKDMEGQVMMLVLAARADRKMFEEKAAIKKGNDVPKNEAEAMVRDAFEETHKAIELVMRGGVKP